MFDRKQKARQAAADEVNTVMRRSMGFADGWLSAMKYRDAHGVVEDMNLIPPSQDFITAQRTGDRTYMVYFYVGLEEAMKASDVTFDTATIKTVLRGLDHEAIKAIQGALRRA